MHVGEYHLVPARALAKVMMCSGAINEINAYPTLEIVVSNMCKQE